MSRAFGCVFPLFFKKTKTCTLRSYHTRLVETILIVFNEVSFYEANSKNLNSFCEKHNSVLVSDIYRSLTFTCIGADLFNFKIRNSEILYPTRVKPIDVSN